MYIAEWHDTRYEGFINNLIPRTALLGNGDVGAISGGDEAVKTFIISKSDFWAYGGSPIPVGGVTIGCHSQDITEFYEKQDIQKAEIFTSLKWGTNPIEITTYLASEDNLLIAEIISKSHTPLNLWVKTWAKADNDAHPATVCPNSKTISRSTMTGVPNPHDICSYKSVCAMATQVVGAVPSNITTGDSFINIDFTLQASQTAYIITAIGGGGKTYDHNNHLTGALPEAQVATLLQKSSTIPQLAAIKAAHSSWWSQFWGRSGIMLDTTDPELALIQKYYYAAQYIIGTNCNTSGVAPGLYGLWHTSDTPQWNSDYHLNYNYIATFYGIFSSNRPEYGLAAIQMILDYAPVAEAAAGDVAELKKVKPGFVQYKIDKGDIDPVRGIPGAYLYPVGIGPYGMKLDPAYHNQVLNSAFCATLMIDYYTATQDPVFMAKTLYPFLNKVARFYEVWLEKEDDKYVIYAGYNEGSWARNSAVELAGLKNVLTVLIDLSRTQGIDHDKRVLWEDILINLAPPPVSAWQGKQVYTLAEAATQEAYLKPCDSYLIKPGQNTHMNNPVPSDGNILPLESVKPTNIIGHFSAPQELKIAQDTIDVFSSYGAWAQHNNFPKIYPIAANVRYPASTIITQLASTIKQQTGANLFIHDNIHGVEKAGAIAAINDMLLLRDKGVIALFPNWPVGRRASFFGLRAGTFIISAAYDGDKIEDNVSILSTVGETLTIAIPWANATITNSSGVVVVDVTVGHAPNYPDTTTFTLPTVSGETYILTPLPYPATCHF
ncbi:MAG: hypothetical protein FWC92_05075 [Defluviitaleaceae bacterium]|nr:hypothetical protein [Defluviitaleaceae bacterium]